MLSSRTQEVLYILIVILISGLRLGRILCDTKPVMTTVAILSEPSLQGGTMYRAVAGARQSIAKTVGAALDALTAQLPVDQTGTLVILQDQGPDAFFSADQQRRLSELMERWRAARNAGTALPAQEQAELNSLVDAEVQAAGKRAAAAMATLGK